MDPSLMLLMPSSRTKMAKTNDDDDDYYYCYCYCYYYSYPASTCRVNPLLLKEGMPTTKVSARLIMTTIGAGPRARTSCWDY